MRSVEPGPIGNGLSVLLNGNTYCIEGRKIAFWNFLFLRFTSEHGVNIAELTLQMILVFLDVCENRLWWGYQKLYEIWHERCVTLQELINSIQSSSQRVMFGGVGWGGMVDELASVAS